MSFTPAPDKWGNRTCGFGGISVHLTRQLSRVVSLFREASKCIISGYAMCGAGAATSVSAKLLASSRTLLAGSVRDFVWHCGDNGKHPVVVGQLSWNWASAQNWRATRLAAAAVPGTSPTPRPYPSRFPRPILNRSVSRIWRMRVSVTISNRRVRTRTHGGVAGVGGQPLPLCRSSPLTGQVPLAENSRDFVDHQCAAKC